MSFTDTEITPDVAVRHDNGQGTCLVLKPDLWKRIVLVILTMHWYLGRKKFETYPTADFIFIVHVFRRGWDIKIGHIWRWVEEGGFVDRWI